MDKPLITWNNWADGIADSPHLGTGLLQAVEIDSLTGAARVGKKPITAFHPTFTSVVTANSVSDLFTISSGTMPNTGTAVTFSNSGGALPAGITANTIYFLHKVSSSQFDICTTIARANAGTPTINFTDNGTGTTTVTTVDPGTINHYVVDPRSNTVFCVDSNGRVWYDDSIFLLLYNAAIDTGTAPLTNSVGNGIGIFRVSDGTATYLFSFRNASIDVINVFGTTNKETPVWSNAWKSMNSGAGSGSSHKAILGQDNIIYFTDDRYIGSIKENAGSVFDPATAGTYTYNNQALDLPLGSLCYWLEQLGVNLLISVSNDSYIYPWDRSSDSYGLPLPIGEYGGNKMKNLGNVVYILAGGLAGGRGNIYWTQGTYVRPFKTVPYYLSNNVMGPLANPLTWGGIDAAQGKLIVGVGAGSGNSGAYMIDQNGKMTVDNIPSTGAKRVSAIYASSEFYLMGYAGGADTMDTSRYSSLGAVILQSQLYRIGDKDTKATISQIEYQIAAGVSGSIRVSYRTDLLSAFTAITTFTTSGSATSDVYDAGLTNLENIQFQVELSGSIDLLEFRAYK